MNPINNETISTTIRGPGILYIFNHRIFDVFNQLNVDQDLTLSERIGTEYDVAALQQTFKAYDVTNIPHYDLTHDQILNVVTEISNKDFSKNSCIIIAVLTHGFQNNVLAARDKIYNFNEIILKISTNRHLRSKPKIYLLQACRGGINLLNMQTDGPNMSTLSRRYFSDEQYILHSATEAFTTYRHEQLGSPFIQTFCSFVNQYGSFKTIGDLFHLVKIKVQEMTCGAQMPEITSNAVKSYTFGDYCQGASSIPVPLEMTGSDGAYNNNNVQYSTMENNQNFTPKMQRIVSTGSQFSEDTRKKSKTSYSKFYKQFLQNMGLSKRKTIEDEFPSSPDALVTRDDTLTQFDKWVKFCPNHIPHDAVVGGTDIDGEIMHVGRGYYDGDIMPGKVFLNRSVIAVPYDYHEIGLKQFEVLTGTGYSWVKAERMGTVPLNAINGGLTKNGEILYIGRSHHDGSLTPGKIQLSESCLYIPFGGREIKLLNYEVLVKSS